MVVGGLVVFLVAVVILSQSIHHTPGTSKVDAVSSTCQPGTVTTLLPATRATEGQPIHALHARRRPSCDQRPGDVILVFDKSGDVATFQPDSSELVLSRICLAIVSGRRPRSPCSG